MEIRQLDAAKVFLKRIGYYRFSGYALHFEIFENRQRTHQFQEGARFDEVVRLYRFDSRLRTILFNAIEMIEVAFRAQLCHVMALQSGDSHWHMKKRHFNDRFDHEKFIDDCQKEARRSREIFITSYLRKYDSPNLPASWMLAEIISFGSWSRVFKDLAEREAKAEVASIFTIKPYLLQSWIHSLTVMRNHCAHHTRIWNRTLTIRPELTGRLRRKYPKESSGRKRVALVIDIIEELLRPIGKADEFTEKVSALLSDFPDVPRVSMGISSEVQT